jgi:hypothetical protein
MNFSLVRVELISAAKMRGREGLNPGPQLWYKVGKYMSLELDDCIALSEVHIYRGST